MEIKKLSTDQDFQSVINNIDDYLKKINDYQVNHQSEFGLPIEELGQFRKSWFYNNWQARFRKVQSFNGLGLTGVINTPNTTFDEWLWWFHEWAESFNDDYNNFKELMFQVLLVIEKHLEAVDTELHDHENRITDNTNRLDNDDVKINQHEQQLTDLQHDLSNHVDSNISFKGVNVIEFGAVGDGQFDNVTAIADAISYAKEHNINAIYFPAGKYYTTGHDVVIAGMKVFGAGRNQSILIKDVVEPFFELRTDSRVTGLQFYDKSTNQSSILKVNNTDGISSSWNIEVDHCWLMGDENQGTPHATWNTTAILFDLNNKGLWDVHLHDNIIYWVDYGVKVDTTNNGWFTGSFFHDLTIKGFSVAGLALMSSNNTARQISQNSISDISVESLYKDSGNDTAIGYIVSGTSNTFSNLMLFRDGAYSGKALQLRSFASSDFLKSYPGFGIGSSANNLFIGGSLEGKLDDPDDLFELQTFINVSFQEDRPGGAIIPQLINSEKKNNFVSLDMMRQGLDYSSQILNDGKAQFASGFDEFGKYLQIDTSAKGSYVFIPFLTPLEVFYGIHKSPKFSVGVKFRALDNNSETPIYYSSLRFAEEEFPQGNKVEWFENARDGKGLIEHAEVYKNDTAYWERYQSNNPRFDAICLRIRPNRSVRIYDSMLVEGQAIDFSKVVRESPINVNVDGGGNNYILDSDKGLVTSTKKTLLEKKSIPFQVDASAVNWEKTSPMTLSFELNAGNLDTTLVNSRLAIYLGLGITFDDGTTVYYYSGLVSGITTPIIRARIPAVFTVPNKTVTSVTAELSIERGVAFDYIAVQRPQLESGTVAHAYSTYVQSTTETTQI